MRTILAKIISYPLLACVALFCVGMMLLYIILPETTVSPDENRFLTTHPKFSVSSVADGSYMSSFEDYTKDQIPFRSAFIKCKAVCETLLFKCENNDIVKGGDSRLFAKSVSQNPQLYDNEKILSKFLSSVSQDTIVAIAPTATEIYPELLPKGTPVDDQQTETDDFYKQLSELSNVRCVDLRATLMSHKDEDLYYHTDHHWTTNGAYLAYCAICDCMYMTPVNRDYLTYYTADDFYGTFYTKYKGIGVPKDSVLLYNIPVISYETTTGRHDGLIDDDKLTEYDKYGAFLYGNDGLSVIRSDNSGGSGRELFVIKDSYANCLIPFLTYQFDTIYVIDLRYLGESLPELLAEHEDATVLILYNYEQFSEDKHLYKLMK